MFNKISGCLMILVFTLFAQAVRAQGDGPVEMADTMRSEGKIYVVITVILTILAGLILYLVRLDRKISKIEQSERR